MLKCILFDVDNTLYPRLLGIFERVVEPIRNYMEVRMGLEENLARELRQEYVKKYGSTLRGQMIHQNIDPHDYLEYVHDVGVEEKLCPNPLWPRFYNPSLWRKPSSPAATAPMPRKSCAAWA
jgi:putative hydrolase of the HAD superfamily